MAITDQQINAWTAQGATQQSSQTYSAVKTALDTFRGWESGTDKEVYLQGSYGNQTNIRGNSDVDVVIELSSTFMPETSKLTQPERELYDRNKIPGTYAYDNFRNDVFKALSAAFPGRVTWGNKCINVGSEGERLNADVVPAYEYRDYKHYRSSSDRSFDRGIWFKTNQAPQRIVINYPRLHLENGRSKNTDSRTSGNFKPLVRAFKNARDHLIGEGILRDRITPSYFLECLIYNIPDELLGKGITQGFRTGAFYLHECVNRGLLPQFICQNGVVPLFGAAQEQWNTSEASQYIEALARSL